MFGGVWWESEFHETRSLYRISPLTNSLVWICTIKFSLKTSGLDLDKLIVFSLYRNYPVGISRCTGLSVTVYTEVYSEKPNDVDTQVIVVDTQKLLNFGSKPTSVEL